MLCLGILTALTIKLTQVDKDQKQNNANYLQNIILSEIERAKIVETGYSRTFTMPKQLGGFNYSIIFDTDKILSVKYRETVADIFINATGNICIASSKSSFNIKVNKNNENITFESCPECQYSYSTCNMAQQLGVCRNIDATQCCLNHCRCC